MRITAQLLMCGVSPDIIADEEERRGALEHVCLALPRMAQALYEQVRQLSCAQAERRAANQQRSTAYVLSLLQVQEQGFAPG